MKRPSILFASVVFGFISCGKPSTEKNLRLEKTVFKLGFKTVSTSTGPQENSAFALKIDHNLPALLVTAHHCVAGEKNGRIIKWNEVEEQMKYGWVWNMQDNAFNFTLGKNLPIRDAETLKLDIAAFFLPSDSISYLRPSERPAKIGDTVCLFTQIILNNKINFRNKGVVVYATDSVMAYELVDINATRPGVMGGTSGSCVLNENNEVVSNSFAAFSTPNEEVRREIEMRFPLAGKLKTKDGKTYGVGVPILLIKKSLVQAAKEQGRL